MSRHCAFCLKLLERPLLCGRCGKRAYCSRECQTADWVPGKGGQGHKTFCPLECCEEDVDWEIRATGASRKGEGVFAKKAIPALAVVIADGERSMDCPFLDTLQGNTVEEKLRRNSIVVSQKVVDRGRSSDVFQKEHPALFLRAAKFNHSCAPNVDPIGQGRATVFVAIRDISPGEELVYNYVDWSFQPGKPLNKLADDQTYLMFMHGFMCPDTCVCRDPLRHAPVVEAHKMYDQVSLRLRWGDRRAALTAASKLSDYVFGTLKPTPGHMLTFVTHLLTQLMFQIHDPRCSAVNVAPVAKPLIDRIEQFVKLAPIPDVREHFDYLNLHFLLISQQTRRP